MIRNFNKKYFNLFCSVLSQAKYGKIKIIDNNNSVFEHSGQNNGPNTVIQIHDFRCVSNFFLKGDLGWAESYIENLWDTKNLTDFLEWGALNFHCFTNYIRGKWYVILFLRLKHFLNSNSKKGSKRNISFHYDLGNEFYKHWLDKSMTYSSAIFSSQDQILYDAQINKFSNLANLCDIKSNDSVLEVGCGWGSFSIYLAKIIKAKVTAITISKKQFELVKKRIFEENLSDKIDVKLLDYRDLKGKFDKIVSIEMFEAVGEKYWPLYFRVLKNNLKTGGKIGLQTITIKDNYFLSYKKFPDFIQTYIFPGGMLPSVRSLNNTLDSEGLKILKENLFGQHYARTLNVWRESFDSSWADIKKSGFDVSFKRLWSYYLSYCEGGFKSGNINVGQFLIGRVK
ncbi:MAG: SAM-dependent methyltransferase [Rickettsiales bacterium]|nr:SAM-dependent methyltransferase [Rickettsiales bacterium]OUV54839.1 MAG: hypothetical protein CBC87_00675 [Rickettsiales bacterium TMED127]|tara:strand:+ start:26501 stop:27691 length:1191 start_codon:yes stop_codon:yes gene_type:complete